MALENLTFSRENASIVDFKIGKHTLHHSYNEEKRKALEKKDLKSTSNVHGYRVSGIIIKDFEGMPVERISKGAFIRSFKHKDVVEYTRKVFSSNSMKSMNTAALTEFIAFLEDLLQFFSKESTRSFVSASILLVVDNVKNSYVFKFIDFNYVDPLPKEEERDTNVIFGLTNMIAFTKAMLAQ